MIYNGKNTLAVALTVGIAMSVLAVNGNEEDQEPDNATIEQIYGLNPGEYPITRGSLAHDTGVSVENYYSKAEKPIQKMEIVSPKIAQIEQVCDLKITTNPIPMAKQMEEFLVQFLRISTMDTSTPMDIHLPTIISNINTISPVNVYWEKYIMVDGASPIERILISIQSAISLQNPFHIDRENHGQIDGTITVSISPESIQAAEFIDTITIASYSPPKIKISDIPIDIYTETTHLIGYNDGMELYQHTIHKIQSGSSLIDIYNETVEAVGEDSPISTFWKTQIFNSMSVAIDFIVQTQTFNKIDQKDEQMSVYIDKILSVNSTPPLKIYTTGQSMLYFNNQKIAMNVISIKPTTPAKQMKFVSKYDVYAMCSEWGSPISELAKIIIKRKNAGLDTSKEEAKFDRILKLQIEYAKRMERIKKTKQQKTELDQ